MGGMGFWQELKRRHVYRVAVAYVVVGWVLIQAVTQVFPVFRLPDWIAQAVVLVILVGFPIALVLAWAFDVSPGGGIRRINAAGELVLHDRRSGMLVVATIGLLIAALAGAGYWWRYRPPAASQGMGTASLRGPDAAQRNPRTNIQDSVVGATPSGLPAGPAPKAAQAVSIPAKSVAVLPFENLSADKNNAYFAAGMQDLILTKLASVGELKVIARTSTEQYGSHPGDLRRIARELGVATIVEGSVQKAGNQVLINVQLIDANTGAHIWAESYQRTLNNIFGVEGEVTQKVAAALKTHLLPAETTRLTAIPTTDPQAYDLYLRAGVHYRRADEQDALAAAEAPRAIALYQQALERDPHFALAASTLAKAHLIEYWYMPGNKAAQLTAAKAAADRALSLQPNLGEGHLALAIYYYWGHRDYARALRELALARRVLPNSSEVEFYFGAIARREARWKDAIAGFRRAAVLDPRNSRYPEQLAQLFQMLGRYQEADRAYLEAVGLAQHPADERVRRALNNIVWKGDLGPLRAALAALVPGSDDYQGNAIHAYQLAWLSRHFAAAATTAETTSATAWDNHNNVWLPTRLYLAWACEAAGQTARAKALYGGLRDQTGNALRAQPDSADLHLALAFADAGLGRNQEAEREGRKVTALMPVSKDAFSGPAYLMWSAQLDVRMGHTNAALDALQHLFEIPSGLVVSPALLRLDPVWDPLRKHPRFQALLKGHPDAHPATAASEGANK